MKIVIIEDSVHDLLFYKSLMRTKQDISLVFFTEKVEFTKDKLEELVDLTSEEVRSTIKNYRVVNGEGIFDFFDKNHFDFFIVDSLGGFGETLAYKVPILPEQGVFFSSTKEFRDNMIDAGYRTYSKNEMDRLILENNL